MKKKVMARVTLTALILAMLTIVLTGCRFGFASDPDDPNEVEKKVPIDTSTDTFEYDTSLDGTSITLLNTKAEIQVALEEMGAEFEKKSGVHVEVMPVTDGDSPYEDDQSVQFRQSAHTGNIGYHGCNRACRGKGG